MHDTISLEWRSRASAKTGSDEVFAPKNKTAMTPEAIVRTVEAIGREMPSGRVLPSATCFSRLCCARPARYGKNFGRLLTPWTWMSLPRSRDFTWATSLWLKLFSVCLKPKICFASTGWSSELRKQEDLHRRIQPSVIARKLRLIQRFASCSIQ